MRAHIQSNEPANTACVRASELETIQDINGLFFMRITLYYPYPIASFHGLLQDVHNSIVYVAQILCNSIRHRYEGSAQFAVGRKSIRVFVGTKYIVVRIF